MINRHLLTEDYEIPTTEKLVEPSRITVKYANTVVDKGLRTDMLADVLIEPFEVKLGFREIDFFNSLNANLALF